MAAENEPELLQRHCCFGGTVEFYRHRSNVCNATMRFSVFRPPHPEGQKLPVLYWLSGLTCTEENVMVKSGAQRHAAEHGIMLVAPDTSPRDLGLPGESDDYDFGAGASFYVNATQAPWSKHYRMYDYVVDELPELVARHFPVEPARAGISGHSMGGHGALVIAFRNPGRYRSVSAYSAICAPMQCAWGKKAFHGYLGEDEATWREYDAYELVQTTACRLPLLLDQGTADNFLEQGQLLPDKFAERCKQLDYPLTLRMQNGYDHSYYFITSFMGDHIAHHAAALRS